jgi:hypothetical protein
MKGYANAPPLKQWHSQGVGLLSRAEIREVQGGGYLPQNNFAFCDMNIAQQEQSMQANPDLIIDPFGDDGEVLIEGGNFRWIESRAPSSPTCFYRNDRVFIFVDRVSDGCSILEENGLDFLCMVQFEKGNAGKVVP